MISERAVREWIGETRQSYADLAREYRERNMNGESFREFNEMAASGCDAAASAISLLIENFDQRLAQGIFDDEESLTIGRNDKPRLDEIESAIRSRAADFNGILHCGAALQLVMREYGDAEISMVMQVLTKLRLEGVIWG